jgi:hypothetical protein
MVVATILDDSVAIELDTVAGNRSGRYRRWKRSERLTILRGRSTIMDYFPVFFYFLYNLI